MKKINADALRVELKGLYDEFKQLRDSSKGAKRDIAEGQMLGILRAVMKLNNAPTVGEDAKDAEWIPVERELPPPYVAVLVYMPGAAPSPSIREGYMENGGTWVGGHLRRDPGEVVAWRQMPEPPEREEVLE